MSALRVASCHDNIVPFMGSAPNEWQRRDRDERGANPRIEFKCVCGRINESNVESNLVDMNRGRPLTLLCR